MSTGDVLQRLASRANVADALIGVLRGKVLAIRAALLAEVENRLIQENNNYLNTVDNLKSRLQRSHLLPVIIYIGGSQPYS